MDEIITQLYQYPIEFNPPATEDKIHQLGVILDCPIEPDLFTLYLNHNGVAERGSRFTMRLMAIEEVIKFYIQAELPDHLQHQVRYFWTDDNSNYAGLYVAGEWQGRICFLNHAQSKITPVFRSVRTFYEGILAVLASEEPLDWYNMPIDALEDLELGEYFLRKFQQTTPTDPERNAYAYAAMRLLSQADVGNIIQFAWDEDMGIQDRACQILGQVRYEPAIPVLAELALRRKYNGRGAALLALGKIGTPQAKEALLALEPNLDQAYKNLWFKRALETCNAILSSESL